MRVLFHTVLGLMFVVSAAGLLRASRDSIGPNGINSRTLNLNGMGIAIGQVEARRPGKHGFDTIANCCNVDITPAGVFVQDRDEGDTDVMNESIGDHPMWVAGVMISKQTSTSGSPESPASPPIGVSQEAALFASAFSDLDTPPTEWQSYAAVTAQQLATLPANLPAHTEVRAINMNFGVSSDTTGTTLDGNSTLTQFIDWSATQHDVLYVVAGGEEVFPMPPNGYLPSITSTV